jgi:hypothetical protein
MNPTSENISASLPPMDAPAAPAGVFPPGDAGDGAAPVALGSPPVPALAPTVRASTGDLADWGMVGDMRIGSSGGESMIPDLDGAPKAEDLALGAVLARRAEALDPQGGGADVSVWDKALLRVAEDLADEDDRGEMPEGLLPDLLGLSFE